MDGIQSDAHSTRPCLFDARRRRSSQRNVSDAIRENGNVDNIKAPETQWNERLLTRSPF